MELTSPPGGDNKLAVALGEYEPTVRCSGRSRAADRFCFGIAATMDAGMDLLLFGDRSHDPEVDEDLPLTIAARKNHFLFFSPPFTPIR